MNKLLLDVDGVLNAADHRLVWPDSAKEKVMLNMGGGYRQAFTLRSSPTMVAALAEMVEATDTHVVWLTTWCENSWVRIVEGALRWSPEGAEIAPYLPAPNADTATVDAWKRDVVLSHLGAGDVVAWVDNDVVPVYEAEVHAHADAVGARLLTLAPTNSPETGLTPEHIEALRAHFA